MLCARQSTSTKYFTLAMIRPFSSNVSVLRELITEMQAKFVRELENKCASLRASSTFAGYREMSRTH